MNEPIELLEFAELWIAMSVAERYGLYSSDVGSQKGINDLIEGGHMPSGYYDIVSYLAKAKGA